MFLALVLIIFGVAIMFTTGFVGLLVYILALLLWCTVLHDRAQEKGDA